MLNILCIVAKNYCTPIGPIPYTRLSVALEAIIDTCPFSSAGQRSQCFRYSGVQPTAYVFGRHGCGRYGRIPSNLEWSTRVNGVTLHSPPPTNEQGQSASGVHASDVDNIRHTQRATTMQQSVIHRSIHPQTIYTTLPREKECMRYISATIARNSMTIF